MFSAEVETVNLFRMMITGAVQEMSPRATLAMINAAGMGNAVIGEKLRSESTIREVWRLVSLVIRRNIFCFVEKHCSWVAAFGDAESLVNVKYRICGI